MHVTISIAFIWKKSRTFTFKRKSSFAYILMLRIAQIYFYDTMFRIIEIIYGIIMHASIYPLIN